MKTSSFFTLAVLVAAGLWSHNAFGIICETPTSISSNFNGTPIAANDYIWFNSVIKVKGANSNNGATILYEGASVNFTVNGVPQTVNIPPAIIVFDASATTASTTYNDAMGIWVTDVPANYTGNVFLSGAAYQLPANLPGGINPVVWVCDVGSDTQGLTAQWQWASAVYTSFSNDLGTVQVKAVDDNKIDPPYLNSDHAGTPENFKPFVTGGSRGGGGSNFTGSYSGTASFNVGFCGDND